MFDFYQKRKLKMIIGSRYLQVFVVIITLLVIWSAFKRYQIASEMAERRIQVEREAAALEERKNSLEAEVNYLSNERGIEAEMRRQFDVALEGEKVVVIVEDEPDDIETIPIATSTNEGRWYEFWQ